MMHGSMNIKFIFQILLLKEFLSNRVLSIELITLGKRLACYTSVSCDWDVSDV